MNLFVLALMEMNLFVLAFVEMNLFVLALMEMNLFVLTLFEMNRFVESRLCFEHKLRAPYGSGEFCHTGLFSICTG